MDGMMVYLGLRGGVAVSVVLCCAVEWMYQGWTGGRAFDDWRLGGCNFFSYFLKNGRVAKKGFLKVDC